MKITAKTAIALTSIIVTAGVGIYLLTQDKDLGEVLSWMDSSWLYRRSISVANSGTELINEDVLIEYDTATLVTAGKLQSDCDDLRFVDSDDATALAYWVEGGCNTTTTHIWVRIPSLPNGGKTIYMYYGNSLATNAEETWTGKFYLMKTSSCDSGWTTESNSGGDYYQNFPYGATSYGTPGGSARHTHSDTNLSTDTTAVAENVNKNSGSSTALNHYHSVTITMNTPSSDILPSYLDLIFCSNQDLIIKQDQVSFFDATVPSGFTRFSSLDSKFPRGYSAYGGSSSTTTHTHALNSAQTGGPSATGTCATGTTQVPTDTHYHTASSSTSGNGTMLPEYITMIFGQANSDIMAPSGTIVMTSSTPPLGWTRFSALDSKFPYGSSSYGTTGGSTTHTHTASTTTDSESATVGCSTGTPRTTRMLTHTHTVSGNLNEASNNPPYIESLFFKKKTSQSASVNNEEINNTAPNAPSALTTEEATNPTGVTDTTPEFSSLYTDPDSDDAAYYQIEVNTASDFTGTTMWDSTKSPATITHNTRSAEISYGATPLSLNGTTYYWRMKFWDDQGAESSWTSAQFTMDTANTPPNIPSALETDGSTNPIKITNSNPNFTAIYSDPEANAGTHYQVQVNTQSDFLGTEMWDSSQTPITLTNNTRSGNIAYNGTTLVASTTYYWRIKFWDNGGLSSTWSSTAQFTMSGVPYAPSSLETEGTTNPTGVTDLTPEFTAIHTDPNQDAATYYQIEVNTQSDFLGTSMWDSTKTATSITHNTRSSEISYNGTTLTLNGTIYYWRIKFWDSETDVSEWSSTANFTMYSNTAPNAPSAPYTEGTTNPIKVTDTTPEFSAVFSDTDGSDTGVYYQIQVNTQSDFLGTSMWDSTKTGITPITNGNRSSNISYAGTTLTNNSATYYWRMKFWDNNGEESSWSSTANFTMSGPPNAPSSLKVDGKTNPTTITSLTPTFVALHTDKNNDSALYYEIEVNSNDTFTGSVMWDTGKTAMTSTPNNQYSPEIVYDGVALTGTSETIYYFRVRFWDSDDNVSAWSDTGFFVDLLDYSGYIRLGNLRFGGIKIN